MLEYLPITGRLYLADGGSPPHISLDTDDAFLCVKPSDVKSGSEAVDAYTATSAGVDGAQVVVDSEVEHLLGFIDIPNAQIVRGMVRVRWGSSPLPGDGVWRQASGTHIDIVDGVSSTAKPQSDLSGYARVAVMGAYSIYVNDLNHLVMNERLVMRCRDRGSPPAASRVRPAVTVDYKLAVGFFMRQNFTPLPGLVFRSDTQVQAAAGVAATATMSVGYAYTGRRVCVSIASRRGSSTPGVLPTAVTIGGVAATLHGSATDGGVSGLSVWSAVVSSGTSLTVSVTHAVQATSTIACFVLANYASASSASGSASASATCTLPLSVGPSQVALVVATSKFASGYVWASPPVYTYTRPIPVISGWSGAVHLDDAPTHFLNVGSPSQEVVNGMQSVAYVRRGVGSVSPQVSFQQTSTGAAVTGDILMLGVVFS